jgi:hypothetical protein
MWALLMDGQQQELVKIRLLYLHKGNWNGEQVLDESWVKYSQNLPIHLRVNMEPVLAECGKF